MIKKEGFEAGCIDGEKGEKCCFRSLKIKKLLT